jgi:hypothetical protein
MTDIEAKALALVNEVSNERAIPKWTTFYRKENGFVEALCRAIEQHEAFKQEVSDAAKVYNEAAAPMGWEGFDQFIIPKPDPLIEVLRSVGGDDRDYCDYGIYVKEIRAALDALGFEIREKNDD